MNVIQVQPNCKKNVNSGSMVVAGGAVDSVYPIGSLYLAITEDEICPLEKVGLGKWELLDGGFCLQTVGNKQKVGDKVSAGLPNIKGNAGVHDDMTFGYPVGQVNSISGCFTVGQRPYNYDAYSTYSANYPARMLVLDASRSNSIYGNSDTVQPPAILVKAWKRVS